MTDTDWTKECNTSNVNIPKFVDMMQKVKSGKEVDWKCPFCGAKVGLIEKEEGHTVIGCYECDMRITLDN